jgi:hypothetical protein
MLNEINQYKLDTHLGDYPEGSFFPLSQEPYKFVESALGIKRQFKGEEFYYPQNNIFLERESGNAIIATIDNIIYKIYFRFLINDGNDLDAFRKSTTGYLSQYMPDEKLNNPEIQQIPPDNIRLFNWRFDWGNLMLEFGPFYVCYIITSSKVRNAKPLGFFDKLFNKP